MSNNERIALVTGASRGIGRAILMSIARDGHTVIGTATTQNGADAITSAISEAGLKGAGLVLDVTDQDSIEYVIGQITQDWGIPTVLINNAGVTRDNLLMRMKDEEWDTIIQTNLSSVYRMTKACLRGMMKARFGRIVNIGSVIGSSGNAGQSNYAAAKAGLIGFTKSLAKEVGSRNVTVNTVSPGFIDTDMTRELSEQQKEAILSTIPVGRLGRADEIARAVVFLCNENSGYITGETLHVNGGMLMD